MIASWSQSIEEKEEYLNGPLVKQGWTGWMEIKQSPDADSIRFGDYFGCCKVVVGGLAPGRGIVSRNWTLCVDAKGVAVEGSGRIGDGETGGEGKLWERGMAVTGAEA